MNKAATIFRTALAPLLVLSLLLVGYGIVRTTDQVPLYWSAQLLADAAWWAGGFCAVGTLLRVAIPVHARALLLLAGMLYLAAGIGWQACLVTLLFFTSCWCLGRAALLKAFPGQATTAQSAPLVVGLALQLALFSVLVHFPVNFPVVVALVTLSPLAVLHRTSLREEFGLTLRTAVATGSDFNRVAFLPWLLLLALIGLVARYTLFPSIAGDDNAVHLRVWTELANSQQYSFDFIQQIWSVAPFALDLLHALISQVAGADTRSALNLALYALLLRQLWCLSALLGLAPLQRLLGIGLFCSTPLLGNLLITLQTELFSAVLACIGVRLLLQAEGGWYSQRTAGLIAIAAVLTATKLTGAVLGLLLLLPLLWQAGRLRLADVWLHAWPVRLMSGTFLLACGVLALHTYVNAWLLTGNPLFPLYNGIFQSPHNDPFNFQDERWQAGFSLRSYWSAFFPTSVYYESRDFVAGFQYLFLLPLGFLWLAMRLQWRQLWSLGLPLFGFGVLVFGSVQYWRYLFPVMPLASLAIVALLLPDAAGRVQRATATTVMLACLVLNLWFFPGISYLMAVPPGAVYTEAGRAQATQTYMPEKTMSELVNQLAPGSRVLYQPERAYGAVLDGDPYYVSWYAPQRRDRALRVANSAELASTLQKEGIAYAVWNMDMIAPPPSATAMLREHFARNALPLAEHSNVVLYELTSTPPDYRHVWSGEPLSFTQQPLQADALQLEGGSALRLSAEVECGEAQSLIVLELEWTPAGLTRRLQPCHATPFRYEEAFAVAPGATQVLLRLYTNGTAGVVLHNPTVEIH